jgi:chromosome segregation ATPase
MTSPNLSKTIEIDKLLSTKESLEKKIVTLEKELETVKESLEKEEALFKERSEIEMKVYQNLEKLQEDVKELRTKESEIEDKVQEYLDNQVSEYINNGKFKDFVSNAVNKIKAKYGEATVYAGSVSARFLEGIDFSEAEGGEDLRINTGKKEYLFDLPEIKKILKTKLMQKVLEESGKEK